MPAVNGQPRDRGGRWRATGTSPEVTVGPAVEQGLRCTYQGIPGHRVIGVDGDLLVLRPPEGGKVLATGDDVKPMPETPEEYQANLAMETTIAKLLVSAKQLSRQNKERLHQPASPEAADALEHLLHVFNDGRISMERYVYVMRATQNAPIGLQHAAVGVLGRPHLTEGQYAALTAVARRAGAVLPG